MTLNTTGGLVYVLMPCCCCTVDVQTFGFWAVLVKIWLEVNVRHRDICIGYDEKQFFDQRL